MINFANITLMGRLTDDPEVKTLDNGNTICKFSVAVNRRVPGGEEKTSYIRTTVFGREAVNCGKYLEKGRVVLVTGEFETDKYTDKNGVKRTGFGVIANSVVFGSGGTKSETEKDSTPDVNSLSQDELRRVADEYFRRNSRSK